MIKEDVSNWEFKNTESPSLKRGDTPKQGYQAAGNPNRVVFQEELSLQHQ